MGQLLNIFYFCSYRYFCFSLHFFCCVLLYYSPIPRTPVSVACRTIRTRRRGSARRHGTRRQRAGRSVRRRTRRTVGSDTDEKRSHRGTAGGAQGERDDYFGARGGLVPGADQTKRHSGPGTCDNNITPLSVISRARISNALKK